MSMKRTTSKQGAIGAATFSLAIILALSPVKADQFENVAKIAGFTGWAVNNCGVRYTVQYEEALNFFMATDPTTFRRHMLSGYILVAAAASSAGKPRFCKAIKSDHPKAFQ